MVGNPVHVVEYIAAAQLCFTLRLRSTCVLRRGARQGVLQLLSFCIAHLERQQSRGPFPLFSQSRCRWHGGVCGRRAPRLVIPLLHAAVGVFGASLKTSPHIGGNPGEIGSLTGRATFQTAEVVVRCHGSRG